MKTQQWFGGVVLLGIVMLGGGCQKTAEPEVLDSQLAKVSIERFLSTWKQGGKPSDLPSAVPPIVVGDPDWESGLKLTNYAIVSDKASDGTNAHMTVKLELQSDKGQRSRPEITYIVGTSPVVTIQRK